MNKNSLLQFFVASFVVEVEKKHQMNENYAFRLHKIIGLKNT